VTYADIYQNMTNYNQTIYEGLVAYNASVFSDLLAWSMEFENSFDATVQELQSEQSHLQQEITIVNSSVTTLEGVVAQGNGQLVQSKQYTANKEQWCNHDSSCEQTFANWQIYDPLLIDFYPQRSNSTIFIEAQPSLYFYFDSAVRAIANVSMYFQIIVNSKPIMQPQSLGVESTITLNSPYGLALNYIFHSNYSNQGMTKLSIGFQWKFVKFSDGSHTSILGITWEPSYLRIYEYGGTL